MTLSLSVADDRLGQYYRRMTAIADRLDKSLPFESVMDALQRIHDGEFDAALVAPRTFPVWKTIRIGGKTMEQLLDAMNTNGFTVSDWAKDIMSKEAFTTLPEVQTINLARAKVRDLGFKKKPTTAELWARIRELGHDLCPAEVGPHLRLQFGDQPKGDYFWVAMEQISASGGCPCVFCVYHGDDVRWLHAGWTDPDDRWGLDFGVAFLLRK